MKRLNPYSGLVGGLSDGAAHSTPAPGSIS